MANLMLSVMGAFAEFERALIRERQREGIALAETRAYRRPTKALSPDRVARVRGSDCAAGRKRPTSFGSSASDADLAQNGRLTMPRSICPVAGPGQPVGPCDTEDGLIGSTPVQRRRPVVGSPSGAWRHRSGSVGGAPVVLAALSWSGDCFPMPRLPAMSLAAEMDPPDGSCA